LPWLAALAAASCWALFRMNGASPSVWVDTLVDNDLIRHCVEEDRCTTVGVGATVGIHHTVGYLNFRALQDWLGFDANHAHISLLTMNAFGAVLVALVARRLGGLLCAAIAAVLYVGSVTGNVMQTHVVSDVAPMPFLGCAFLMVCSAAPSRPGYGGALSMGLVGAITANCYASGFTCGVSAVAIALLAPERPVRQALVAAATFIGVAFFIAPGTFIVDAQVLISGQHLGSGQVGGRSLSGVPIMWLGSLAAATWLGSARFAPALRRALDVPFAVFAPVYVPFVLGSLFGVLEPQDKYFCNAAGAIAVAVAVGCVGAWRAVWPRPPERRSERFAPHGAVLVLGLLGLWDIRDARILDFNDMSAAVRVLASERGWAWTTAFRNLRTTDDMVRQSTLRWARGWGPRDASGPGSQGEDEVAYLFKAPKASLPAHLPPNVTRLAERNQYASLLAVGCSWIDWRDFIACDAEPDGSGERCLQTGFPTRYEPRLDVGLPGMPVPDARKDRPLRRLRLRIPLHARAACPQTMVHMPMRAFACPGRIVSVDGGSAEVERDQRTARLARDPETGRAATQLVLEWQLGGPSCSMQYRGYPPYFLDGDPEIVQLVMAHEARRNDEGLPPPP
jgi:hypothetical protein